MPGEILINYNEVYSKTAEMRQRIQAELREVNATYRQTQSTLRTMDGKTNAAFMEALQENQQRIEVTADTLHKLLSFIENSAREVERNEQMHARVFNSSRVMVRRGRGGTHNA